MPAPTVIIQRLTIDLHTTQPIDNNKAIRFVEKLKRAITTYFEKQEEIDNEHIRIDSTQLQLDVLLPLWDNEQFWEEGHLQEQLNAAFSGLFRQKKQKQHSQSQAHNLLSALGFFLQKGCFPWWFNQQKFKTLDEIIGQLLTQNPSLFTDYIRKLIYNREMLLFSRLIKQLKTSNLIQISEQIAPAFRLYNQLLKIWLKKSDNEYKRTIVSEIYYQLLIFATQHQKLSFAELQIAKEGISLMTLKTGVSLQKILTDLTEIAHKQSLSSDVLRSLDLLALTTQSETTQLSDNYLIERYLSEYSATTTEQKLVRQAVELITKSSVNTLDIEQIPENFLSALLSHFLLYNVFPQWAQAVLNKLKTDTDILSATTTNRQLFQFLTEYWLKNHTTYAAPMLDSWLNKNVLRQRITILFSAPALQQVFEVVLSGSTKNYHFLSDLRQVLYAYLPPYLQATTNDFLLQQATISSFTDFKEFALELLRGLADIADDLFHKVLNQLSENKEYNEVIQTYFTKKEPVQSIYNRLKVSEIDVEKATTWQNLLQQTENEYLAKIVWQYLIYKTLSAPAEQWLQKALNLRQQADTEPNRLKIIELLLKQTVAATAKEEKQWFSESEKEILSKNTFFRFRIAENTDSTVWRYWLSEFYGIRAVFITKIANAVIDFITVYSPFYIDKQIVKQIITNQLLEKHSDFIHRSDAQLFSELVLEARRITGTKMQPLISKLLKNNEKELKQLLGNEWEAVVTKLQQTGAAEPESITDKKSETYKAGEKQLHANRILADFEEKAKTELLKKVSHKILNISDLPLDLLFNLLQHFFIYNEFPYWARNIVVQLKTDYQLLDSADANQRLISIVLLKTKELQTETFHNSFLKLLVSETVFEKIAYLFTPRILNDVIQFVFEKYASVFLQFLNEMLLLLREEYAIQVERKDLIYKILHYIYYQHIRLAECDDRCIYRLILTVLSDYLSFTPFSLLERIEKARFVSISLLTPDTLVALRQNLQKPLPQVVWLEKEPLFNFQISDYEKIDAEIFELFRQQDVQFELNDVPLDFLRSITIEYIVNHKFPKWSSGVVHLLRLQYGQHSDVFGLLLKYFAGTSDTVLPERLRQLFEKEYFVTFFVSRFRQQDFLLVAQLLYPHLNIQPAFFFVRDMAQPFFAGKATHLEFLLKQKVLKTQKSGVYKNTKKLIADSLNFLIDSIGFRIKELFEVKDNKKLINKLLNHYNLAYSASEIFEEILNSEKSNQVKIRFPKRSFSQKAIEENTFQLFDKQFVSGHNLLYSYEVFIDYLQGLLQDTSSKSRKRLLNLLKQSKSENIFARFVPNNLVANIINFFNKKSFLVLEKIEVEVKSLLFSYLGFKKHSQKIGKILKITALFTSVYHKEWNYESDNYLKYYFTFLFQYIGIKLDTQFQIISDFLISQISVADLQQLQLKEGMDKRVDYSILPTNLKNSFLLRYIFQYSEGIETFSERLLNNLIILKSKDKQLVAPEIFLVAVHDYFKPKEINQQVLEEEMFHWLKAGSRAWWSNFTSLPEFETYFIQNFENKGFNKATVLRSLLSDSIIRQRFLLQFSLPMKRLVVPLVFTESYLSVYQYIIDFLPYFPEKMVSRQQLNTLLDTAFEYVFYLQKSEKPLDKQKIMMHILSFAASYLKVEASGLLQKIRQNVSSNQLKTALDEIEQAFETRQPVRTDSTDTFQPVASLIENDEIISVQALRTQQQEMDRQAKEHFDWLNNELEGERIYIENAGLVLFWPFYSNLFKRLNFFNEEGDFRDSESRERAVHLLQFMGNGSLQPGEHLLALNKILCGMSVNEPIERFIKLSETEKNEALAMLKAAIGYWEIIQDSSVEAVREGFILREGILVFENENWHLKVEQTGLDVLLRRIPWGFGTIKLSWNDYIIFVEWLK